MERWSRRRAARLGEEWQEQAGPWEKRALLRWEHKPCCCQSQGFLLTGFLFLFLKNDLKTEEDNNMLSFIFQSLTLLPAAWHRARTQQALSDADFSLNRYGRALCAQLPVPSAACSAAGGLARIAAKRARQEAAQQSPPASWVIPIPTEEELSCTEWDLYEACTRPSAPSTEAAAKIHPAQGR